MLAEDKRAFRRMLKCVDPVTLDFMTWQGCRCVTCLYRSLFSTQPRPRVFSFGEGPGTWASQLCLQKYWRFDCFKIAVAFVVGSSPRRHFDRQEDPGIVKHVACSDRAQNNVFKWLFTKSKVRDEIQTTLELTLNDKENYKIRIAKRLRGL